MKKIILSLLVFSQLVSAKAIVEGKEIENAEICSKLKESLPGIYKATESYYSIKEGNKVSCNEITVLNLQEAAGTELFGVIIGLTYNLDKLVTGTCSKDLFYENIINEATKNKTEKADDFNKVMEAAKKLTEESGCSFEHQ